MRRQMKKKKPSARKQIDLINQHIISLYDRLSSIEIVVSAYIELKKDQKKLKKFLDDKAEQDKKENMNEDNTTV